ncbi:MAG: D-arabinono-1,4-lactone oxidase [Pseudomonadales bacterium]
MATWSNWSGRQQARPQALHFVRSEADLVALVRAAAASDTPVRAAGAGHSHAPLVPTDGLIVDLSGLAGVVAVDQARQRARVWAGTPIHALGRPLHDVGLGLSNQGDIDRQAIAGACATGTHGTGRTLRNLSAAVTGVSIVLASGELLRCSADERAELFQAARLHLGALGVVTQLELQLRTAYRLQEHGWSEPFEALGERISEYVGSARHFEFFWYPHTDTAVAKTIDETDAPPSYPLAAEGARCAWSYEVLPNHRPHRHTEMEYSVPAEAGLSCMREIRQLIQHDFPGLRWPVEYRTLAADDVWLSTAYERDTVTISVHQDIAEDETGYYRACEAIFLRHGGRPHWGKVHYLDGTQLGNAHPRWEAWWQVRDRADPRGLFLNEFLRSVRPGGG